MNTIDFNDIEKHLSDSKKEKIDTVVNGICTSCGKPFSVGFYSIFRKKDFSQICHKCKLSKSKQLSRWEDITLSSEKDINFLLERIKNCNNPSMWIYTHIYFNCKICKKSVSYKLSSFVKNPILVCSPCKGMDTNMKKYGYKTSFSKKETQDKIKNIMIEKYGGTGFASSEIKDKIQQTNIQKYGAENPLSKGTSAFIKRNSTVNEKYGVDNVFQLRDVKDKIKETNLSKYGAENPFASEVIKDKIKETNNTLYGADYPQQNETIRNKIKSTCLERYGTESPMGSEYFKNKSKQTCLEKYGVEYPMKLKEFQDRVKQTCLEKYGVEKFNQSYEFSKYHKSLYTYDNINFDSSWELMFYIYHKDLRHNISRASIRLEYVYNSEKHYYFPDFVVDNKLYEIKGPHFFKEDGTMQNPYNHKQDGLFEAKRQCGINNNVVFISEHEMKEISNYVYKKYSKNYISLFKKNLDFPFPNETLSNKSDFGVIQHFHKSIYYASKKNKLSPYNAWFNKNLIKRSALNRLKYVGSCKPSDIIQGFNIAGIAPKISVFKPKLAEDLIKKYISNADTIIDPFSGFSGRMLGAYNCGIHYIGWDINEDHVRESNEIVTYKKIEDMCDVKVQDLISSQDRDWSLKNVCLFTCPPYGGKEHWNKNNDEIEKSCDEWIDLCLEKHKGCQKYLFVVDKTEKYKDYIVEAIENKSHFGKNYEYVVLL